jgi:hypothetical protein
MQQLTIDHLGTGFAAIQLGDSNENSEPNGHGQPEEGLVVEILRNGEQNIVLLQVQMKTGQNGVVRVGMNPVSDANDVCVSLACGDEEQPNNYMKWMLLFGDGTTKSCVEVSFDHEKPEDSMFYRPGQSFVIDKSLTGYVRKLLNNDVVVSQSGAPVAASTRDAVMVSGSEDEVEEKDEDTEISPSLNPNVHRANGRTGKWARDEDSKLQNAVHTRGGKDWGAIAALVPGRTEVQCNNRWHKVLDPSIDPTTARAGKWTEDEVSKLKDAVQTHGGKNWVAIAALVPGRTKTQCYNRWKNVLDPSVALTAGRTD